MRFRQPSIRWVVCLTLITCIVLEDSVEGSEELDEQNVVVDAPSEGKSYVDVQSDSNEQNHRYQFDPLNPKNFALVAWASATRDPTTIDPYPLDLQTVGTFIATNTIVCAPSTSVPIDIKNVSNWYVHHVTIGSPPKTIKSNEFVVLFHPDFKVSRKSPHRLAMVVLNGSGEKKAEGIIPLFLTAFPFFPTVKVFRENDYALANCKMVVYTRLDDSAQGKFAEIPFVTKLCKYTTEALNVYKEKVCGEAKMMKDERHTISDGFMYPNDMGAPLLCGNVLVGVYSGIQNIHGNRYSKKGIDNVDKELKLRPGHIGFDEQYTFDIPGGEKNFLFLGNFVNHKEKKMEWSMKIDMSQTDECLTLHDDVVFVEYED